MREENRKETLTREIIKKELKEIYIHNLILRLWGIPLLIFLGLGITWMINYHLSLKDGYADTGKALLIIQFCIVAIIGIWAFSSVIYIMYKFISLIVLISKNEFDVVIDRLVDKEKSGTHKYTITEYSIDEMELSDYRKPYVLLFPDFAINHYKRSYVVNKLRFSKRKWFYIPEGKLYRWSEKYKMEHWAVYRWAEIDDEFYLITVKNKVLYVYNTKHFELKD